MTNLMYPKGVIMTCSVIITKEENWMVATDFTTGIASQGKSIDEAMTNLREALELYYEDNEEIRSNTTPVLFTTMEVTV